MKTYLTRCPCGRNTSKTYARQNGGKCKACVTGVVPESRASDRQGRIIDQGWDGYAREEGHYDLPDYA